MEQTNNHLTFVSAKSIDNGGEKMELTVKNNGNITLSKEASNQIVIFEKAIKELKTKEEILKKAILIEMETNGIVKFDNEYLSINYVAGTDREVFDKKRFQKENPELYDEYIEMKPVKSSVRIKVK